MNKSKVNIIYRCGWCGTPVTAVGSNIPRVHSSDQIQKYLDSHQECNIKHVNGACCPNGDGTCWE